MSIERISITELLRNHDEIFEKDDSCGFYDWFCKDSSLKRRALKMLPKLQFLVDEGLLNGDDKYVWFKNSCPLNGDLYDEMGISSIGGDEDYLGGLCPACGHTSSAKEASIWMLNDGEMHTVTADRWVTLKKELKTSEVLREMVKKAFS